MIKNKWNLASANDFTCRLDALLNYLRATGAMSLNGKRSNIWLKDILKIADDFAIKDVKK